MNRRLAQLAVVAAIAFISAVGVAKAADTPDSWVTMKTKVSLMTTEGVSTSDLNVDTVDGVKEVKNLLQVVPRVSAPSSSGQTIKSRRPSKLRSKRTDASTTAVSKWLR
ncbi:MAG TPA: hypothetical protein VGH34_23610 [Vicinamibacterales bacterium]